VAVRDHGEPGRQGGGYAGSPGFRAGGRLEGVLPRLIADGSMSGGGSETTQMRRLSLPWATLKYDAQKGGYVVDLNTKQLEGAPTYDRGSEFEWTPDYGRSVDSYYKVPSYWM
jgi:hypothetical protein